MKTVYVGLSGGVDSATSAYLLKQQGYNVVGAFIKGWEPDFLPCTGVEDRVEAMRVAAHLGIPFVTYDLETEYKQDVVDYFVSEYRQGRTPNPDVMCNRTIKFGAFWERAKKDGADYIATGHYAIKTNSVAPYQLDTSRDSEKDQTYFLWTLRQDDLSHTLFPVGALRKPEVRDLAKKAALPNALRRDSQGLCFLGHVDMHDFLIRYIPPKVGDIITDKGEKCGEHDGAWFYTLGQHVDLGGQSSRMYVIAKNIENNTVTVSANASEYMSRGYELGQMNWISGNVPSTPIMARYRYRQALLPVEVEGTRVAFESPQQIAEGQSIVFYDSLGITCLGGAIVATPWQSS